MEQNGEVKLEKMLSDLKNSNKNMKLYNDKLLSKKCINNKVFSS